MKIIEAMKQVKENKEKIADLQNKIANHSANLSYETAVYGADTPTKIKEWAQSCHDLTIDNVKLLTDIGRTNVNTQVTITLCDRPITKTIAEWIWRRREYAAVDLNTWSKMTDRGLREGQVQSTPGGEPTAIKIVRHYDPVLRDKMLNEFRSEPHKIDAALEIVNATTELVI